MEDPLRPKTVPLSAETVLWFEFLLDPSLLTAYLSKTENAGLSNNKNNKDQPPPPQTNYLPMIRT